MLAAPPPADPILTVLDEINKKLESLLKERELDASPWLRGDKAAAAYAGFKSVNAFVLWAKSNRIKPIIDGRIKRWDRHAIVKARKAAQTY